MASALKIYPLGGVGEIGRNLMVWEYADWRLVVDCGLTFPEDTHLGVDYLLPDWAPLKAKPFANQAVILTHGHDDHIGALPFFLKDIPCPVYGPPFALALAQGKLSEHGIDKIPLRPIQAGKPFTLGPFSVEPVHMNHSIPQVVAFAITTPFGRIVHATDWKIDRTPVGEAAIDEARFRALGEDGTLLLFSDSTNAENHGYTLSETEIGKRLLTHCKEATGRLFVTLFASNGARVHQVAAIAKACGRKVVLCGRSLKRNVDIFDSLELFDLPKDEFLSIEQGLDLPDHKVLFILTGSQAEPRSVLYRMSHGGHKLLKVNEGDTIIFSSKMIPGNERAITRMINQFCRYGARVIYEDIAEVHTSGHAKQGELSDLISWLRPRYFVPIHGEYRHLVRHAQIAVGQGVDRERAIVIENGQELIVDGKGVRLGEKNEAGKLFIDGTGLGDVSEEILRDRRYLSKTGVLICLLMINADTGAIVRDPELIARGFFNDEIAQDLLGKAKACVVEAIEDFDWQARSNPMEVEEHIHLVLRQFFNKVVESKPLIIPLVVEV
jgi:ribonuclease J